MEFICTVLVYIFGNGACGAAATPPKADQANRGIVTTPSSVLFENMQFPHVTIDDPRSGLKEDELNWGPPEDPKTSDRFVSTVRVLLEKEFVAGKFKGQRIARISRHHGNGPEQNDQSFFGFGAWNGGEKVFTYFSKLSHGASFFTHISRGANGKSNGQKIFETVGAKFVVDSDFVSEEFTTPKIGEVYVGKSQKKYHVRSISPYKVDTLGVQYDEVPGVGVVYFPPDSQYERGLNCSLYLEGSICVSERPTDYASDYDVSHGITELRLVKPSGITAFVDDGMTQTLESIVTDDKSLNLKGRYLSSALYHCDSSWNSLSLAIQPVASLDLEKDLTRIGTAGDKSVYFFKDKNHALLRDLYSRVRTFEENRRPPPPKSYEEFLAQVPVVFTPDSFGRIVRFLNANYTTKDACIHK